MPKRYRMLELGERRQCPRSVSVVEADAPLAKFGCQRFGRRELHGVEAGGLRAGDVAGNVVDEEDFLGPITGKCGGRVKDRRVRFHRTDLVAESVNAKAVRNDPVLTPAILPVHFTGVREDAHPVAGLLQLGDDRHDRQIQLEDLGGGRHQPVEIGVGFRGGAEGRVELPAGQLAGFQPGQQFLAENGVAHGLGVDPRHRTDLLQHLLDAEVNQNLAQIKVEELCLHEGTG